MEAMMWVTVPLTGALLLWGVWGLAVRYCRNAGSWLVDCPETESCTDVTINVGARLGDSNIRVRHCGHWPERAGCEQACVR